MSVLEPTSLRQTDKYAQISRCSFCCVCSKGQNWIGNPCQETGLGWLRLEDQCSPRIITNINTETFLFCSNRSSLSLSYLNSTGGGGWLQKRRIFIQSYEQEGENEIRTYTRLGTGISSSNLTMDFASLKLLGWKNSQSKSQSNHHWWLTIKESSFTYALFFKAWLKHR